MARAVSIEAFRLICGLRKWIATAFHIVDPNRFGMSIFERSEACCAAVRFRLAAIGKIHHDALTQQERSDRRNRDATAVRTPKDADVEAQPTRAHVEMGAAPEPLPVPARPPHETPKEIHAASGFSRSSSAAMTALSRGHARLTKFTTSDSIFCW